MERYALGAGRVKLPGSYEGDQHTLLKGKKSKNTGTLETYQKGEKIPTLTTGPYPLLPL